MGGTPFISDDALYLPVQDCTHTYGGSVGILKVELVTEQDFSAHLVGHITPEAFNHMYCDGCHTLSGCLGGGDALTFVDVKHMSTSWMRYLIDWQRRIRRFFTRHDTR